jgi:hypothetical protein
MAKDNERERLSYVQIDSKLWAVMRENQTRPRAMINRVTAYDGVEQYFLMTRHPEPPNQREPEGIALAAQIAQITTRSRKSLRSNLVIY